MLRTFTSAHYRYTGILTVLAALLLNATPTVAGPYLDSAHGNLNYGASRTTIDGRYADYATGNCAHCHESHASLLGSEPMPANGPAAHTLFSPTFNKDRTQNPYLESDDFCFSCHSEVTGPQVRNQDYSVTFGGGTAGDGPQSIMAAFNQTSYHNLYDIWKFVSEDTVYAGWFGRRGNPCSACHNPHLARRNWDVAQPGFPLVSAISKPGSVDSLWGENETMISYFGYEAPYAFAETREPASVGEIDGDNTPDYVGFCSSCHNPDKTIWSTSLNRNLLKVNWGDTGLVPDKHGDIPRDGSDHFREPYATATTLKSDFILSCLDCHEPHGSANIMLLRSRINGETLEGTIDDPSAFGLACKRCHTDDLAATAGTNEANRWEYIHHGATDAPYAQMMCGTCHGPGGGSSPIACGNCHGHGLDDSWLGGNASGRKTF